jgi:hypothetical protein
MHEILPCPAADEQFAGYESQAERRRIIALRTNIPLGNSLLRVILLTSIRIRAGTTSSQEEKESMIDPVREAVEAMLKNRRLENRQSYLVRGRRYQRLSDNDLYKRWAEQMNRWADDSIIFDQRALNDLGIEMGLRELAPPLEQIAGARQKILAKTERALATINASQKHLE